MTDLPFKNATTGLNAQLASASPQSHETVQPSATGLSRLTKITLFVALTLAILIIFVSTAAGSRMLGQLGMLANAAELDSQDSADGKSGNVLTAFLSRSPGERGVTDAFKDKAKAKSIPATKVADTAPPKQRALGKIFDAPANKMAGSTIPQPVLAFLPDSVASEAGPVLASVLPNLGSGPSIFSPVSGGGIGGGGFIGGSSGGGSGGGSGPIINPPPVPAVASAVPEPSTWIFLLLGFAAIGASIRRPKSGSRLLMGQVGSCVRN